MQRVLLKNFFSVFFIFFDVFFFCFFFRIFSGRVNLAEGGTTTPPLWSLVIGQVFNLFVFFLFLYVEIYKKTIKSLTPPPP